MSWLAEVPIILPTKQTWVPPIHRLSDRRLAGPVGLKSTALFRKTTARPHGSRLHCTQSHQTRGVRTDRTDESGWIKALPRLV